MKKIQVSTVKQTADVEVIYVNAHLISKAIKSLVTLEELDGIIENDSRRVDEVPEVDAEGKPVVDGLTGEVKTKEVEHYTPSYIDGAMLERIHEIVVPFLKELTNAFEEE
jgi:hypothetical protein